jgi:hypothetical protein
MKTRNLLAALITAIVMNGNLAWSQTELFRDNFNSASLDETNKWRRGNATTVAFNNGLLQMSPPVNKAGWIVTQDAFSLDNTTIKIKILQANKDGNIGICPSYPKSTNDLGIYSEPSWYRFYVGRNASDLDTAPYRLYAHKKKQGGQAQPLATIQLPTSSGSVDLRFRFDGAQTPNAKIYFEYSTNGGANWTLLHQEAFDLPGYSLRNAFHGEIATTNSLSNTGTLQVDEFEVTSNSATPMTGRIILDDPLNNATFVNHKDDSNIDPGFKVKRWNEGSNLDFTAAGWKPNPASPAGDGDLVHYDLRRYIEKGMLEVDVTQFQPEFQNNMPRHHVLAMFRMPWGGHHVVENLDAMWDFHTGKLDIMPKQSGGYLEDNFGGGVKLYSHTYAYDDENQTYVTNGTSQWNKALSYHLTVFWEANQIKYLRDGVPLVTHPIINSFNNEMQLRYVYVGRDRTVCSGDFVTGFMKNQYKTMRDADGPIYSNLVVKELVSTVDVTPPLITVFPSIGQLFANGARVIWSTSETNVICYVKYGTTSGALNSETTVLDPPANSTGDFSTLLSNLAPNTTYYYRIVGQDNAGNIGASTEYSFTTLQDGVYVFKPTADTYIEANETASTPWLYGNTRADGNYGWMNLMTAKDRDCFLQFNVNGITGAVWRATLWLHGRQTGETGGILRQFTPLQSNWEDNATWKDATSSTPQYINRSAYLNSPQLGSSISTITAGQWYGLDVSSATRDASNNYYFVMEGTGTPQDLGDIEAKIRCGAFDSKESTNFQPELIVETTPPAFTEVTTISLPGVENGDAAWGDYDKDGDLDILITGLSGSGPLSKIFRNDNNGSAFVDIAASLEPLSYSAADWGDFDMDNSLDILLAGQPGSGPPVTKVYRNNYNGNFVEKATTLIGIKYGDLAWGNYDNDRYLDIVLSGWGSAINFATKVYKGSFSNNTHTWAVQTMTLPQLRYSSVAWGHNNPSPPDGYVDLLLAGTTNTTPATDIIEIYKNIANADGTRGFALAANQLPSPSGAAGMTASCVWGNFDTDDDLDVAFAGRLNTLTSVYKRLSNGTYEGPVDDAALIDVKQGTVAWGDYDNDGDLDLLLTGQTSSGALISKVYSNDPPPPGSTSRKFVDIAAPLTGVYYGSAAWGDYDNDGDLDILLTGNMNASGEAAGRITKIYKNLTNVTNKCIDGDCPSVPTLSSNPVTYSAADNTYTLNWNKSTDNQTPQPALTYNVMIGTTSGGFDIVSPISNKYTGKRWIPAPGNAGTRNSYIFSANGLANGTYYWKVQAIDNVFGASVFSTEATFTVPHPSAKAAGTDSLADSDSTAIAHAIPETFALSQNYPNPFNPTTRLNLNLPEHGHVKAIVYDLTGQEVRRLQDATMTAGYKHLDWDGKNNVGANVSSGAYLVKVVFEGVSGLQQEATSRVTLLK